MPNLHQLLATTLAAGTLALPTQRQPHTPHAPRAPHTAQGPSSPTRPVDPARLAGLSWRAIGPAVFGGRIADVAGAPGDPAILYVAAASSGLFKSTNGGTTFESIFNDGNTLSIGAIAVQPDNPNVVYVGTGEGAVRNSISFGDGIYKTTDGGRTWTHLGLTDTERFARIAIDPTNPRIVFAAALGHAFGPNTQRGVFRSTDGGATWHRVLYVNPTTGASDVAIDPKNPRIVYAGMYDYQRTPWSFRSGGPGSGLYRSSDGGTTWTKLTDPARHNGLPGAKLLGRIGISIHRNNPNIVYALIEAQEEGVLWRSDDRGHTWHMVSNDHRINNRPFYYTQVRADPVDPNRVYTLSGTFNLSTDGGHTFRPSGGRMFGDHHALWIDPTNPKRLLCGTDGGFFSSNDGARTWDFVNNIPLAQAYHVSVDMALPYHVLGGFQDHEIWRGPNEKWNQIGVRGGDWVRLRYMADGMYAIADPRDPNIIYYDGHFGDITRIDMRNQEERYIQPYPPGPAGGGANLEQYRFNWNSPILISPTNPDVVYYGGNVLFKTTDGGATWTIVSPDLTTNDPAKQQPSGGPITPDNTRAEFHCTIIAIAQSPLDSNVIWVGTDDGNVQLTRDGGKTWTNVAPNIPGAPKFSWVAAIRTSFVDPGTAYIAIDQHRLDDFTPYAVVTTDYGKTWRRISNGLRGYVHVVIEDPKEPSLLYAGTELGIYASFDRGATWTDLRLGLPHLAVVDMTVHPRDNDLVIATHARGFYILDDVTPLQQLARVMTRRVALFHPMPAIRYTPASDVSVLGDRVWIAPNKPYGAIISYYVAEASASPAPAQIEIRDPTGRLVRSLEGPARPGIHRVVWNLAEESSCGRSAASQSGRRARGGGTWLRALPGTYAVRLIVRGETVEDSVVVRLDPRVHATPGDLRAWYQAAHTIEHMECRIAQGIVRLRALQGELDRAERAARTAELRREVAAVRGALRPVVLGLVGDVRDPGHVNVSGRVQWLTIQVGNYTGPPTAAQREWIGRFDEQTDHYVGLLERVIHEEDPRLNARLEAAGLPPVEVGAP
jgi:photosystem II stability/assembly factor-like uncharacterized protein